MYKKTLSTAALLVAVALLSSCVHGNSVRMESADAINPAVTYRVILQGGNYYRDLRTVVFLDREDDGTLLSSFTPDFEYRVLTGVPADQALSIAEQFLRSDPAVHGISLGRIADRAETFGYEIRPRYLPFEYGSSDPLDIGYYRKAGEIRIIIRLKPGMDPSSPSGPDTRDGR